MSSVVAVRGRVPAAWRRTHPSVFLLGALMALAAVVLYRKGLGTTFYYDEWSVVMERRGWDLDAFFRPHNEHIVLVPVLVFKILFVTVGLDDYWAYRLSAIVLHLVCVGLLFVFLRRRLDPWLALIGASLILFLGSAWQNLLWPFQIVFVGSVAAGVGMFLALERRTRGGDVAAAVLLGVSLAFSTLGLPFAAGAAVEVLLRSRRLRELWIPLAPLALWGIWYLAYGKDGVVQGTTLGTPALIRQNLPATPGYVGDMIASGFGALVGLGLEWGRPLALAAVVVLAVRLARPVPVSARLIALLVVGATYWGLTAAFRAQLNAAAESRYTYLSAVLIVLVSAELLRGSRATRRALSVLGVIVFAAALANFGKLREGSLYLQEWSSYVAAELGALEVAGDGVDPGYRPDPVRAPPVHAGPYLEAVEDLGSPADTPEEIRQRPEVVRQAADAVLIQALRIGPYRTRPLTRGDPPHVAAAEGAVERRGPCVVFRPTQAPASVELEATTDVVVRTLGDAPAEYRLRFFADGYPQAPHGTFAAGATQRLPLGRKALPRPWRLRVTASDRVNVCTAE